MAVYILQAGDKVKIGVAANVEKRRRSHQISCPDELRTVRVVDGGRSVERWFHQRFASQHVRGEWFHFHADMLTVEPGELPAPEPHVRKREPMPLISWAKDRCTPQNRCERCRSIMAQPDHPYRMIPWAAPVYAAA